MSRGLAMMLRGLVVALAVGSAAFVSPSPTSAATQVGDVKLVRISKPYEYNSNWSMKAYDYPNVPYDHVFIEPFINTSASKWKMHVRYMTSEYWIVSFQNTYYADRCLDKKMTNTWEVYLYPCHYQDNQLWRILKVPNASLPGADVFEIQNKWSGTYLRGKEEEPVIASDLALHDSWAIFVLS